MKFIREGSKLLWLQEKEVDSEVRKKQLKKGKKANKRIDFLNIL